MRSSAEMWGFLAPLEAMQMRSVRLSTQPKAQQLPQEPWSRTSFVEGHMSPHWSRESKEVGRSSGTSTSMTSNSTGEPSR